MKAQINLTDDDGIRIKTTFYDHARDKPEDFPLEMTIEICSQGITITPTNDDDKFSEHFIRDTFVEFYLSQMVTHVWDGTQEDPVIQHVLLEKGT